MCLMEYIFSCEYTHSVGIYPDITTLKVNLAIEGCLKLVVINIIRNDVSNC